MAQLMWAANPLAVLLHFRKYRYLVMQLVRREVENRYRGSILGLFWSLLTPLLILGVYVFVFTVVFQARWGDAAEQSRADFALSVFVGLTLFQLLADMMGSAPSLILANRNYVKKVVFPLEILPVVRLLSEMVQAGLSLGIVLVALLVLRGTLPWTFVLLPLPLIPLTLICLGLGYFLASLGVFIRDIQQIVQPIVRMLLFLSAVFYPVSQLPPRAQTVLYLNPLVPIITDMRRVLLEGLMPDWSTWAAVTAFSAVMAVGGLAWFMKSKNAFSDVL